MVKKLAALAGAGALLLGLATPVFADVLVVNFGGASQETVALAGADTGGNSYTAGFNFGNITQSGNTTTGNAGAVAGASAVANQYDTSVWTWWDCGCDVAVMNVGGAEQVTGAGAGADTGDNYYLAGFSAGNITQSGDTTTGDAGAVAVAQSWANIFTTSVNTWPWP